jgi:UDP-N-acetylglucosamine--N-acetylmuramyl-(pentapeptide) pyrophosphoryl-undecaprenol N-acetylglucosamine transferase
VVGLAAAALRIPFITHDSDAIPGLGNRVVARWAKLHTVALSKEIYSYPQDKTVTVGIPVQSGFVAVTPQLQASYKKDFGFSADDNVLLVTGGGQGAQRLNMAVIAVALELFDQIPNLHIVHLAGHVNEKTVRDAYDVALQPEQQKRVAVKGYITDLYRYSGAADVIVTRAGATTMAEFAVQHKACVMVPNPYLTGGQQSKNAKFLTNKQAVLCVTEDDLRQRPETFSSAIEELFHNTKKRHQLEESLGTFAHPNAAKELAMVLLNQAA